MIYTYTGDSFDFAVYIRRTSVYLLSLGMFIASQYLNPLTLWRALKVTTSIWLAFGALRYISPGIYYSVVRFFVPELKVTDKRGTSSLAPEATDFGFTMVVVVILCLITRHYLTRQGMTPERWPLIFAIISVLLSLSGTGYVGLAVVGAMYALIIRRRFGAAILVIGAVTTLSLMPSEQVRGAQLLQTAIMSPAALMDTTASYRVVHATVGVLGMVDSNFLGYGAGSFRSEAPGVYYRHDLGSVFELTNWYAYNVPNTLATGFGSSQFATILLEFGLPGLLYLAIVYGFAVRSKTQFKSIALVILLMAWAGSFTVAWPPFWILLGVLTNPYFTEKEPEDRDSPPSSKIPTSP